MVSGKLYVVCCIDSWKIVKDQLNPNPCAAPAFFSLDLCQIVQINRLPRTDSAPIVPSWYGEWTVDRQLKLSSGMVYLECNNLIGWKLDTQRVGNGSPSLDSQTHTSRSSCCVHMGSTAMDKFHKYEYTRVVDDLNVYSTRVKFLLLCN